MDVPLELSFRNMDVSPAVETRVRERAAKLEQYFQHLTSCRVIVEAPPRQGRGSQVFHVTIEMGVPRKPELVVRNDDTDERHEDIYYALGETFDVAERRLRKFSERLEGKANRRLPPDPGTEV